MLGNIRRASHQSLIADLADLHNIICYQTMSSLDQLQRRLALSDSALAHNQNALAEYIDQHAVDGDHRASWTFSQRMISAMKTEVDLSTAKAGT